MTEKELMDSILSARTKDAYKKTDKYLKEHPKEITDDITFVIEAYEMYRRYAK